MALGGVAAALAGYLLTRMGLLPRAPVLPAAAIVSPDPRGDPPTLPAILRADGRAAWAGALRRA